MTEIDLDLATREVEQCDFSVSEEYADLLAPCDETERRSLQYTADYLVNKLKFRNAGRFLEDVIEQGHKGRRDFSVISEYVMRKTKIIDVGCGWGRYARRLSEHSDHVFALDHVFQHCIVTKYLNPHVRVFHGDARELKFEPETFDIAVAKDLIEHVGSPDVPYGPSGANLSHQFRLMSGLSRITRLGGHVYVSTGNYKFPWDGENNIWFYHWLDEKDKESYNVIKGISSDKYWLLTWEELSFLLTSCGLAPAKLVNFDGPGWDLKLMTRWRFAFGGLDSDMVNKWRHLVKTDPRYWSGWNLVATKVSSSISPQFSLSNRCYYYRATGSCCPEVRAGTEEAVCAGAYDDNLAPTPKIELLLEPSRTEWFLSALQERTRTMRNRFSRKWRMLRSTWAKRIKMR